jgi:hypothetical protein
MMTNLNNSDARKKWCPFAKGDGRCVTDNCMMWKTESEPKTVYRFSEIEPTEKKSWFVVDDQFHLPFLDQYECRYEASNGICVDFRNLRMMVETRLREKLPLWVEIVEVEMTGRCGFVW